MVTLQMFDPTVYLSLAFLFGLATQFKTMEGELFLRRITAIFERRIGMLYAVVVVASLFSALLLNDVVIIILTPVILRYAKQFKLDVVPLLVAEITFVNIASSLTPLGNPQNILLWSASKTTFLQFTAGTWFPVLLSTVIAVLILYPLGRKIGRGREFPIAMGSRAPAVYLSIVIIALVLSDFTGLPVYIALGASFLLGFLFTFHTLGRIVKEFDLKSLLILYFFVAITTVISTFLGSALGASAALVAGGVQPFSALFVAAASCLISNVPTTQLILTITSVSSHVAPHIAVEAGLAGNLDPIASFANLLALLMVRRAGLPVRRAILLQSLVGVVAFLPALL